MLNEEKKKIFLDEKLVGDRVEKLAECRDLVAAPRKMSVEYVRERRDKKKYDRENVTADTEDLVSYRR